MNDFEGLLSTDYGFKPHGKSAPMAPPKSSSTSSNSNPLNFEIGRSKTTSSSSSSAFLNDHDVFRPSSRKSPINNADFSNLGSFDDVFANSKSSTTNNKNSASSVNFDSIFVGGGGGGGGDTAAKFSSLPVFDKPVYDDDVSSSANKYDDIFAPNSSKKSNSGGGGAGGGDAFDDLWGGLGKKEPLSAKSGSKGGDKGVSSFDDLLPGFGRSSSPISNRSSSGATKKSSSVLDDPFVVLESSSPPVSSPSGIFSDPLEEIGNLNKSGRKKAENSSDAGVFDDIDPLDGFATSVPPPSGEMNGREKDEILQQAGSRASGRQTSAGPDAGQKSTVTSPDRGSERKMPVDDYGESPHSVSEENKGSFDEVWLTVSEIPLFTQPTAAPPPSRPPPPRPAPFSRADYGSVPASNAQRKHNEYSSFPGSNPFSQSPKSAPAGATGTFASSIDELEEFAMARNRSNVDENSDVGSGEDFDSNSVAAASAAAMKEAMDRAEAKFRYAKGVRERENAKASKNRDSVQVEKEDRAAHDAQEREFREGQERLERVRQERGREEEERRRMEKEQEEKEREKRRIERERELARQAVERAAREARERAAIEARSRAERAAVQKVHAEARERAERAAVQRAQAEARERAAADAKERAEKAAAEAREKARAEAREKEAREKAAAARANQQKSEPDFDSIFGMGSRANSAPRPRASSSDPWETQFPSKPAPEATRSSVNSSSSMRKASSSTNIVDDLSSIFGEAPPSSGQFPDIEGESDDRRRARLERHQRTQERAAKALAEKNARDLEVQREQAERSRISETLDIEIKRWAAGKEGNLRALLSTMQYVLWPECGWQPVSLTDLITGAAVKKVYRKATLCIHPDKVQQKGATLQQKYVAEKVFDLLKEAWNKFNSEELF